MISRKANLLLMSNFQLWTCKYSFVVYDLTVQKRNIDITHVDSKNNNSSPKPVKSKSKADRQ